MSKCENTTNEEIYFLNEKKIDKLDQLIKEIEDCNFIRDNKDLKEDLNELIKAFINKGHYIYKGRNGDYVSIFTKDNKEEIALTVEFFYGRNHFVDDGVLAGLILTKTECYKVYFSGEENQNKKIYQDEDLTKLWQDILAKKYGKNLNA